MIRKRFKRVDLSTKNFYLCKFFFIFIKILYKAGTFSFFINGNVPAFIINNSGFKTNSIVQFKKMFDIYSPSRIEYLNNFSTI